MAEIACSLLNFAFVYIHWTNTNITKVTCDINHCNSWLTDVWYLQSFFFIFSWNMCSSCDAAINHKQIILLTEHNCRNLHRTITIRIIQYGMKMQIWISTTTETTDPLQIHMCRGYFMQYQAAFYEVDCIRFSFFLFFWRALEVQL